MGERSARRSTGKDAVARGAFMSCDFCAPAFFSSWCRARPMSSSSSLSTLVAAVNTVVVIAVSSKSTCCGLATETAADGDARKRRHARP